MHRMAERKRPKSLKRHAADLGVEVTERTLRVYVAEGRLKHVARDGTTLLYDIEDVTAAIKTQGRDINGKYKKIV